MNPTFVRYYDQELRHVRDMGAEFAAAYPDIAAGLGMQGIECADPYVERLLEGFAFMAARVQMKIDAQYPVFARHLTEMVYPGLLAPVPSMAVVAMQVDAARALPPDGVRIARGAMLRGLPTPGAAGVCRFRTAHDVVLLPLTLRQARYVTAAASMALGGVAPPSSCEARAALRLDFERSPAASGQPLDADRIDLFLAAPDGAAGRLYEALLAHGRGFSIEAGGVGDYRDPTCLQPVGFDDDDALLPTDARSFSGHRLLREYFACPRRYLFVSLRHLRAALAMISAERFSITVWMDRFDASLEGVVDASAIRLFCTPAINLFHREADRVHLREEAAEFHVVADRTRPMDFEVYGVDRVRGYGDAREPVRTFQPFHGAAHVTWHAPDAGYYSLRRESRVPSSRSRQEGARSGYLGSEVYLSLVDAGERPVGGGLRQLGMRLLCTQRDLPLRLPLGQGDSDFTLEADAPVASIRCVSGPTWPRGGWSEEASAWTLLTQLQIDHLSLLDDEGRADGWRELLSLHGGDAGPAAARQIGGLHAIRARPVVRRLNLPGPALHARGVEVALTCDADAYVGTGVYLFGAVLARFLSRYVSLNTFCDTVLITLDRAEVARWTTCPGSRPVL